MQMDHLGLFRETKIRTSAQSLSKHLAWDLLRARASSLARNRDSEFFRAT